jgi:hypothetical protein
MKDVIELDGRVFDSKRSLCKRFGVSVMALQRWKDKGLLPPPIRLGKANFYDRRETECRLAASAAPLS